jgi:endoglucanase
MPKPEPDGGSDSIASPDASATLPFLAGVNLSCAEFGSALPGTYDKDYTYPTQAEVGYFVGKGMKVFRLPFRWERLQQQKKAALDKTELSRIDAFIAGATGKGAYVVLDPHNYARYNGQIIGQASVSKADFADLWSKLAAHFKSNPLVIFGVMNEPHDMGTELWRDDANAAIQAIRAAGAMNLILVPGNGWTGAHSWDSTYYGTANAVAMLTIVDPGNNYAFEVHQYLDSDSSGTSASCVSAQVGVDRLKGFTAWLKQHGARGFLGEFGCAASSTCLQAVDNMLGHIDANRQHWIGWTWWAAGPWWGDYMFSIEPKNGKDAAQLSTLLNHL